MADMTPLEANLAELETEVQAMRDLVESFPAIPDSDPLDTAKHTISKLTRQQRRDLIVHLMEQDNAE